MAPLGIGFAIMAVMGWHWTANAISLTNRDDARQSLVVIEGDSEKAMTLQPMQQVEMCVSGCVIRLGNGDEYRFFGEEIVSIEEGLMFLDVPEAEDLAAQPR